MNGGTMKILVVRSKKGPEGKFFINLFANGELVAKMTEEEAIELKLALASVVDDGTLEEVVEVEWA